ncbi:protein mono-ADP-ribosyltransferase PARP14-like [Mya arenaria]|uniref:protein mono-ADP-ribosyltransferase PARP14-like n=1 Tax=Mya arenaria TaxID=6604 RepID=UPI0022E766E3|nr:protein mono-ADP-ribosyltransferase PARP14-like [Mya arenaria]
MTAREEIVKRCVVVPGVPRTISADHLVKNISIPDGGQVICGAVVEGAESDTNLQRWIFQLNDVLCATKLKETQHVQIEVEGESLSFEIVDAVECDIPLQWTQSRPEIPERHHGPINMGPYNPQMNPANFGAVSGYYMNYQPPGHEVVDQAGQPPVSQAGFPHQGPPGGHPGEGGQGQPPPPGFTQAPFGHPGQAMSFGFPHPGQRPPGPGQAPPMPQIIFDQQARMPMVWHPYYGRYVPAPPNMFQQAPQGQGPALEHHSDPQQAGREPQMPHDLQDGPQGPPPPYNSESDLAPETHHTEANENIKAGFEQDSKAIADQDTYMQKIQGKIQAEHEGGLQSGEEDITASKQFEESEPSYETEENCTAVLLRNIPINVHEEYIELFFENKKNFSDVKVSKVAINRQEKTAVVEFEDEEASRIVLEKETIIIKKTMIAIEPYIPRPPTPEVTKEDAVEDDVLPKVVLKDLPDDVDQEEIEMVFQSKKRVGDIELVEIVYNEEDSLAIVTLGNQDSLDTLLEKSPLKICGKIIHVEEYELPNDMDTVNEQPKIFVTGVPEDIDFDDVEMVFENRRKFGDTKPLKIDYNEDEQSIVLTYENESAVDHVLSKCPLKIRGVVVQLEKLEEKVHAKEDISDDEMSEHVVEFDGTQTKILVEDIPESIDVEALEMYFEARKLKCCEVIDVDLDEEDRNAVIEFAKPSHVEAVLKHCPHHLKRQKVSVQIYVPKRLDTIIVKGPPDIVNEDCLDSLEMYFDNKRKSGGGGVVEESSTFSAEENAVYLTFEEEEVAKRVVNRGNHKVHKKEIEVTLFKPKRATKRLVLRRQTSNLDSKSSSVKHTEVEQEPVKTIRVRGMKKISSRESVNWYFENKKRAGGGDIENRYTDEEDDDIIYIRFKEEEVANAVAEREHHTVDGVDLAVALYTPPVPPPSYSNKILFKGLNEKITESVLGLFLEARANCNLVEGSLTYHADSETTAIVTTEQDIDLEKLELACNKPLEGSYLKVACVPISNCILVSNISDSATKDMIELYFENNKRSNGGPVSKVEMFKNQGYCLVYFNDYKTVDSVLCKEQKLAGNTVEVKRYIQCIARAEGDSVNRRFRLPEPISISVSQLKKRFTQSSQMAKTALEAQMNMCHATITWSEETPSVELSCSLTTDVKDCIALACNWKNQAEQNFNDFMDKISEQNMPVMEELWEKITPKLADVSLEQPDAAAVYMAKKEGKISVVGMKHVADPLISEIEAIIKSTSDELSKEKQFTRQTITTLRPLETRMLLADKFPIQLKESFPEVEVRINQGKNETIIEGIYQDVNKVLLKMYELKDRFCTKDFQFPTQVLCLYDKGNKTVKDYIVKKLKNSRVVAVWENTGNKLIVMAVNKETLDTASKVVRESVLSKTVLLSEANISVLQTDAWVEKKRELTDKYREKLVFDTNDLDKLVIGTTDDIANEVVQNIQSFLRAHSILKDTIKVPKNVYKLLKFNHVNDIHTIASSLQSEQVRIFSKDDAHVIEISGTKHGMEQAKSLVETLLRKVIKTQHQIRKPGLREYMQTEKGIEITRSVESTLPCVISMNDDSDDDDDMGNDKICVIASCTGYETRRMFAAVGDMSEINVDVIVNPSDDKIGLSGGLGRILKMKGGQALERPCRDYIENNGRLSEGEVFVSPAGNLKAKYVIHVIGPVWNGGTNQEDDKLTEVVFKAMKQASLKNMKSLAMPAISCGVYGFPVKKATGIIVAAVKNFFREEQDSSLTEIYLCDMKDDTVDAFTEALQKEWGDQNVKKHASQRQRRKPEPIRPMGSSEEESDSRDNRARGPPLPNRNPGETVNDVQVGNITISVVKDEIAKFKTPVIVNTTAKNLDLNNGAVSKTILRQAGKDIQKELKQKYPDGLSAGEIAVTSGYNMDCSHVLHGAVMNWDGKGKAIEELKSFVKKCLQETDKRKLTGVAFPAIGTGNLGYPRDIVADEMFDAVADFANNNPQSTITKVAFILYPKDVETIKAFEEKRESFSKGFKGQKKRERQYDAYENLSRRSFMKASVEFDSDDKDTLYKDSSDLYFSPHKGLQKVRDPKHWLEDEEIDRACKLIKNSYPDLNGLQDVCVVTIGEGVKVPNPMLQILHSHKQHWVVASTVDCADGVVRVFDSMNKQIDKACLYRLLNMVIYDDDEGLIVERAQFQKQKNNADCGVFAIAAAFSLSVGNNPSNLCYDTTLMRQHLFDCLKDEHVLEFPCYDKSVTFKPGESFRVFLCKICNYLLFERRECSKCDSNEEAEHIYEELPVATFADSYSFGSIKVTIKSGDITGEDAECIVNSSNEDLDFKRGKVSQALMKKCGKALLDEANSKKANMKKHEVVITKAPNLKCSNIMHVVAKESPQDWKQIVVKCLDLAKKEGYNSLAFPALGTGMSAGVAAATAQVMVQATKEFAADGCGRLTDVRFVIFQKEMVDVFNGAVRKAKGVQVYGVGLPPPPKTSPGMFGKFNGGTDAVLFTLWALEQKNISAAIDKLERGIEREISKKEFTDTVISRMDDKQLKELKKKAEENKVEYKLKDGTIQIVGVMPNVVKVTDDIYNCLRDAVRIEQDQNAAMILKDVVQWYWIEQTEMEDDLKPYKSMLNYQIEQAFKAQKDKFTYIDQGDTVVVDFKDYTEYYESKPSEKDTILRKDLIKEFGGEVPANWKAMKGNLLVYKMVPTDQEYTDIAGKFSASSGAGFTIHAIEKVQNKSLWLQYEAKKKQLEGQNPPGTKNEQFLWHGTSEDTVDSVNAHGFNRSYCGKNATAYGDGVYFAVQASYSCSNTYSRPGTQGFKRVYYCAVLTGVFDLGKGGMRVPPPNPKGGKNALFDSVVNNVANPGMYIIFNDTQAYPLYIVTFKSP